MEVEKHPNQFGRAMRWLLLLGGGAAVWYGLRRRSLFGRTIRRSETINTSREELYRFWKNFGNLPHFMKHLQSVRVIDNRRSHWVAKAPTGRIVEWDAEIVADRGNELIAWRSTGGSVAHAGSVRFERVPGGRGAVVRVQLQFSPAIARWFVRLAGSQVAEDLHRLKRLMEAGEIPATDAQPLTGEPVETASEESFPASDAPSWAAGGGA
jgi:uncharacterized membrane protein